MSSSIPTPLQENEIRTFSFTDRWLDEYLFGLHVKRLESLGLLPEPDFRSTKRMCA